MVLKLKCASESSGRVGRCLILIILTFLPYLGMLLMVFFFFCWSLQTFLLFSILCDFSFKVGWALVKKKFLKKTLSNRIVRGDRGEYSAVP